jgi:hypothetical protein
VSPGQDGLLRILSKSFDPAMAFRLHRCPV